MREPKLSEKLQEDHWREPNTYKGQSIEEKKKTEPMEEINTVGEARMRTAEHAK